MKRLWNTFLAMNTPSEWRARFARNKWVIAWGGAVSLFILMVGCIWWCDGKPWQGALMQTLGTATPVYAAVIIFLQSKAAGDKATREQMEHMQRLNQEELVEMRRLFQVQMDHLAAQTNMQIERYGQETFKVIHKLGEHSDLLAALLKRELEKAIADHNANMNEANRQFRQILKFQVGRTPEEKQQQVTAHQLFMQRMNAWGDYIQGRYRELTTTYNPKF